MAHSSTTMDMTKGSIWKSLFLFSLPLLLGNLFQQLYSTVDSLVVGNFVGADALGAVTSMMPAVNTLIGLFMGISTGASVIISQYFGAHDPDMLKKAIHTSLLGTFILSLIFDAIGYVGAPYMVRFMRTAPSITPLATVYLRILLTGSTSTMLYNMGSAVLRAVGDSKRPLYFLIFTSLLNVVLDLYFVVSLKMSVAGAALATVMSQYVSAFLILFVLYRSHDVYQIRFRNMKIHAFVFKQIIDVGMPAGFQQALTSFSNVFVQAYINFFGAASTTGWGVYFRIDAFILMPMMTIALAVTTFTGQNAGARNLSRIKEGHKVALKMAEIGTLILALPALCFAPEIVRIFNTDPDVVYYGTLFIRTNCWFALFACLNQVYAGVLRGIGDARAPMVIMLFSFVFFRQIYLFMAPHTKNEPHLMAFGYPLGWMMCSFLLYLYYQKSGWEKRFA